MNRFSLYAMAAVLGFLASALTGCNTYHLQGRVIEGETSAIVVVDPSDPRLHDHGLASVSIHATLDPRSGNRKQLGMGLTRDDGTFSLPIDATGAGFLEYEIALEFERRGFFPTVKPRMPLPPPGKRLLVVMTTGIGKTPSPTSKRPSTSRLGKEAETDIPSDSTTGDDLRREIDKFEKQFK